eukprot:scaffold23832_cov57-Phaeocystis_antarctica.AAC.2
MSECRRRPTLPRVRVRVEVGARRSTGGDRQQGNPPSGLGLGLGLGLRIGRYRCRPTPPSWWACLG